MKPQAQYIMVGGFLGAGKTTTLLKLAELFRERGQRVGLITNDQSVGLVDTAMLAAHDFPVQEITGGCFCCRFNSLTEAAEKLSATERPDVFLAEPVGSCTDLTATVSYPLRRLYGNDFHIAPFSVLVDPIRAERILGLTPGKSFSPKVQYIYFKQLEEADFIVINKVDLLDPQRIQRLITAILARYSQARILTISSRDGTGLPELLAAITTTPANTRPSMEMDYDTYAEGEALLGWVNLTMAISATNFDGNQFLQELLTEVHSRLSSAGVEIAHLKMTLTPDEGSDIAVINLVRTDGRGELSHTLEDTLESGQMIFNLRAEGDPEQLKQAALESVHKVSAQLAVDAKLVHGEAFRPSRPVPTHRDA